MLLEEGSASDGNSEKDVVARLSCRPFSGTEIILRRDRWALSPPPVPSSERLVRRRGPSHERGGRTTARTTNRLQFFAPQPTNGNRFGDTESSLLPTGTELEAVET